MHDPMLLFTGMVAATNEQVIVTLDIPGGGRSNWAIEVVTLRALPGSHYNVVYGFATAPVWRPWLLCCAAQQRDWHKEV